MSNIGASHSKDAKRATTQRRIARALKTGQVTK